MPKRKALSTKIRFEVFKRDSFKCQYCGSSAPDVILNVDHIKPVAKGGDNDILNLVTSCFTCNSGKKHRLLSDNSVVTIQKKQLDELNERREQLTMMIEWKMILSDKSYETDKILEYFNKINMKETTLSEYGVSWMKTLLKKYTAMQFTDAIDYAYEKYGGIESSDMWDKVERALKYVTASDADKNKMKLFGGIKARFGEQNFYKTAPTNRTLKSLFALIDSEEIELTYSDLFEILNFHKSYNQFAYDIEETYKDHTNQEA